MEQSKPTEQEEEAEQWVKDSRAGCQASKEVQGIGKAMLTIRRRRSTSLRTADPRRQEATEAKGNRSSRSLARGHTCHQRQASTSEAGSCEGLPADGGGVCGRSGAFEATGR